MSCGDSLWPVQAHDWEGRWIRWAARGYELHLRKRPQLADWHEAIGRTLADPEVVAELPGGGWSYYRRGVLPKGYGGLYLLVVVRWLGALGDIATAFPVESIRAYDRLVRVRR